MNRKPLLSGEEQRKISKVYITAFMESTLRGKEEYIPIFRDYRYASRWLPDDIYINRFKDSSFRLVSDFEEDVDVTTTSLKEGRIQGNDLGLWREEDLGLRVRGTKSNNVAYIGWRMEENEESEEQISTYSIELPESASSDLDITADSFLVFSLAEADEKVPEPDENEEEEEKNTEEEEKEETEKAEEEEDEEERQPLELSIELVSADGASAKLPLRRFMDIPPVLKARFTKLRKESQWYGSAYEPTLQTFELPLKDFMKEFPEFDPSFINKIRFIFDGDSEGVIILDNVGFAEPLSNSEGEEK